MAILTQDRRLTVSEYVQRSNAGEYGDSKTELIDGKVIVMSPVGWWHSDIACWLARALNAAVGTTNMVRENRSVEFSTNTMPQPDLLVCAGPEHLYKRILAPSDVVLAAEVSDTTLRMDLGIKKSKYAQAGIPEYWVINQSQNRLEVYMNPVDGTYTDSRFYQPDDIVELSFASGVSMAISAFLK